MCPFVPPSPPEAQALSVPEEDTGRRVTLTCGEHPPPAEPGCIRQMLGDLQLYKQDANACFCKLLHFEMICSVSFL